MIGELSWLSYTWPIMSPVVSTMSFVHAVWHTAINSKQSNAIVEWRFMCFMCARSTLLIRLVIVV